MQLQDAERPGRFCVRCADLAQWRPEKRVAAIRRGDGAWLAYTPTSAKALLDRAVAAGICGSLRCGLCRMDTVTIVEARRNFTRARNCRQDHGCDRDVSVSARIYVSRACHLLGELATRQSRITSYGWRHGRRILRRRYGR